ncbi:MAG: SCO family protein [Deltaproteobacteria bacterium]|nr:SCO family protein [Deltaproteobacteria bacterium]
MFCFNPKRLLSAVFVFLLSLQAMPAFAAAPPDTEALREAFDASVKAEGTRLDEYALVDQDGVSFKLSDYFTQNKPLVISFVYTTCPQVCPTITAELKSVVDNARTRLGNRFNVLTIGFDPANDTPEGLKRYGHKLGSDFKDIRFATGSEETVRKLTRQVGFFYKKKEDGSFDHIDMVTVVRPDGTIYKQVYSLRTQSATLGSRLEELITGKTAAPGQVSLIDRLKYFCYKYDPYTGRYVIDYPIFLSIFIQLAVILAIIYAVWGKKIIGFFKKTRR